MTLFTAAAPAPAPAAPAPAPAAPAPARTGASPISALRRGLRRLADEDGAATAEYAITTMAAVAFAGLLVAIMRSDEVRGILTDLIRRALSFEG